MKRFAKLCIALIVALSLLVSISNAQIQIQGPRASEEAYSGVVYGPIDSSDTLWRIASRYKQDTQFSVYQTMLAIYQLNPRSFENNNFNTMVDGAMLQMPSDQYIARMDPRRAKAKADADERSFAASGRGVVDEQPPAEAQQPVQEVVTAEVNLKDAPPLVNQEDLSKTQKQLQDQLNALNRQQNSQFESVKEQVSASIENVQSLIDENKKLYERLDQVNSDIADLRSRVEGEMQSQIDEQLTMQRELLDLIKAEQAKQAEDAKNSWINLAKSPTGLIAISTSITLIVLGLVAYLLLRRKSGAEQAPAEQTTETKEQAPTSEDIVDDELVIGEAIDEVDEDTDELLKALSDEAEEDDVLSDQLEDGLDEIPVDKSTDDFEGLEDEMLVPDSTEQVEEEATAEDPQADDETEEKVSFDSDAISLDEDDFDNQSIDLSSEPESSDASEQSTEGSSEEASEAKAPAAANNIAVDPNASVSDVPEGIQLNEDGEVDENTIDQIEQKIQEKDAEITQLTNEILEELETASAEETSEESAEDGEEEVSSEDTEDVSPDDIDALLDGVNTETTSDAEERVTDEPTDELIKEDPVVETSEETNETVEDSSEQDVSDIDIDALIEAESAPDTTVDEVDVSDEATSTETLEDTDISDDVLDADESTTSEDAPAQEIESSNAEAPAAEIEQDALVTPNESESQDSLADEITNELEDDIIADEELDSLLDEFTAEMEANAFASELPEDDIDISEVLETASLEDDTEKLNAAVTEDDTSIDLPERSQTSLSDAITDEFEHKKSDLDEDIEKLNSEQPLDDLSSELDEDILADLPEVDDWVDSLEQDTDTSSESKDSTPEFEQDEIEQLLDATTLDAGEETDAESFISPSDAQLADDEDSTSKTAQNNPLNDAGLDVDALMTDMDEGDFTNVDDLIAESDSSPPLSDDDLELNLDGAFANMMEAQSDDVEYSLENYQSSNLDLAQIYIDMEDFESAGDVLREVLESGSDDQKAEAQALLKEIEKA